MRSTPPPRRVALYARVSLDRNETKSVAEQLAELRAWAEREGWQIVGEYRDDGVSASRYANGRTRPGWQRAMDDTTEGRIDALLVWDFSRASRDDKITAALKAACVERGVKIGYGGMLRDPSTADGGFYVGLDGLVAAKFSADLSEKMSRSVDARAAAGRPHGSIPYGYRRLIDPNTGRTIGRERHPDQAPIVAEIVRRLLAREPADRIAADLNRRGVSTGTGQRWLGRHLDSIVRQLPTHPLAAEIADRMAAGESPTQIAADLNARALEKPIPTGWRGGNLSKLALRPVYAGLRVHQGRILEDVRGTWPPIITEAQHHALVAMHRAPERDKFRNPTHVRHLGTGLFRCGREGCGGVMRTLVSKGAYSCRKCYRTSRVQGPVDELVTAVVVARLSRPDAIATLAGGDEHGAQEAADEAARLRRKLAEARQAWDADRLSLESFTAMEAATLPKIADAERRARPQEVPAVLAEAAGPQAKTWWDASSIESRRALVDALMTVTILPGKRGARAFDPTSVRIDWKT